MELFKQQPKCLPIIFFMEMWDRFTYYGVLSILVIYLTKHLDFTDNSAYTVYGIYSSLSYMLPIIGGFLADKWLGYGRSISLGIILIIMGCFVLMVNGASYLYTGLSFIICGIGLFKANNASLLGAQYQLNDVSKESGFTLFYVGMNIGAILGPIIFGYIALRFGLDYGFALCAIGMLSSLILFRVAKRYFQDCKSTAKPNRISSVSIILGITITISVILIFFKYTSIFSGLILLFGLGTLAYLIKTCFQQHRSKRNKLFALIILNLFSMFYFACSLQVSSSMLLFISRDVNTHLMMGNINIPTAAFASLEPIFVILAAPLLSPLWVYLNRSSSIPPIIIRTSLGLFFAAAGFIIFAIAASKLSHVSFNYPLYGIILGNFILGAGELCIGPALISAVTYLAPTSLRGTFMGFWYLSIAFAAYLSSLLAKLTSDNMHVSIKLISHGSTAFAQAFFETGLIALTACILLVILSPFLKRLIKNGAHQASTQYG